MWLVYLLLVLDAVTTTAMTFWVLSSIGLVIAAILCCVAESQKDDPYKDFTDGTHKAVSKIRNVCLGIFIPCMIIGIFVPDSKQMAMIYTVGNTIEYVQGNEKIKELPDKAVKCLDKFIDEYLNEEKQ